MSAEDLVVVLEHRDVQRQHERMQRLIERSLEGSINTEPASNRLDAGIVLMFNIEKGLE